MPKSINTKFYILGFSNIRPVRTKVTYAHSHRNLQAIGEIVKICQTRLDLVVCLHVRNRSWCNTMWFTISDYSRCSCQIHYFIYNLYTVQKKTHLKIFFMQLTSVVVCVYRSWIPVTCLTSVDITSHTRSGQQLCASNKLTLAKRAIRACHVNCSCGLWLTYSLKSLNLKWSVGILFNVGKTL